MGVWYEKGALGLRAVEMCHQDECTGHRGQAVHHEGPESKK